MIVEMFYELYNRKNSVRKLVGEEHSRNLRNKIKISDIN